MKSYNNIPIENKFPDKQLWMVKDIEVPWYTDYINFIVSNIIHSDLTFQQKKKFLIETRYYYWENSLLFRVWADGGMRRCIPEEEMRSILEHC